MDKNTLRELFYHTDSVCYDGIYNSYIPKNGDLEHILDSEEFSGVKHIDLESHVGHPSKSPFTYRIDALKEVDDFSIYTILIPVDKKKKTLIRGYINKYKDGSKMKTLDNTNIDEVKKQVPDVKVFGNGDLFQLISKASSKSEGWMKSTKAMDMDGGVVIQVTTQNMGHVAEALTFVRDAYISVDNKGNKVILMKKDTTYDEMISKYSETLPQYETKSDENKISNDPRFEAEVRRDCLNFYREILNNTHDVINPDSLISGAKRLEKYILNS